MPYIYIVRETSARYIPTNLTYGMLHLPGGKVVSSMVHVGQEEVDLALEKPWQFGKPNLTGYNASSNRVHHTPMCFRLHLPRDHCPPSDSSADAPPLTVSPTVAL